MKQPEYETFPVKEGKKFDNGKTEWDLLPTPLLEGAVKVLMGGRDKYEARDWAKVANAKTRYFNGLKRHVAALQNDIGEIDLNKINEDDFGYPHLWHVMVNAIFLEYFRRQDEQK